MPQDFEVPVIHYAGVHKTPTGHPEVQGAKGDWLHEIKYDGYGYSPTPTPAGAYGSD
jgi:hypothetical protein